MDSLDYVVKKILGVIRNDVMKYISKGDSTAIVKRVDGNTAWVHFDGGVPETPVAKSINCKKGDKVRVRNSGGTPFLVGNDTAPPTDDTKAEHAQATAEGAEKTAEDAQTTASEAVETAEHTSNYFWHVDGSGAESGAHITEVPRADFEANPTGGNLLMQTDSIDLRIALETLFSIYLVNGRANLAKIVDTVSRWARQSLTMDDTSANLQAEGFDREDGATQNAQFDVDTSSEGAVSAMYADDTRTTLTGLLEHFASLAVVANSTKSFVEAEGDQFVFRESNGDPYSFEMDDNNLIYAGKSTFGALDNGVFALETHQILSSQAIAGGAHVYNEVAFTKAGYYPLCIAGWNAPNAVFVPSRLRLKDMAVGSATVAYDICNPRSSSGTSNFNADILWLKVTA